MVSEPLALISVTFFFGDEPSADDFLLQPVSAREAQQAAVVNRRMDGFMRWSAWRLGSWGELLLFGLGLFAEQGDDEVADLTLQKAPRFLQRGAAARQVAGRGNGQKPFEVHRLRRIRRESCTRRLRERNEH